jgi:hypothetical protein
MSMLVHVATMRMQVLAVLKPRNQQKYTQKRNTQDDRISGE